MGKLAKALQENVLRRLGIAGISQAQLAHNLKVKPPQISRLLSDEKANPQLETVERIAEQLGVNVEPWKLLRPEEPAKPGLAPAPIPGLDDLVDRLREVPQRDATKLVEMFWEMFEFKFPEKARQAPKARAKDSGQGQE